MTERTPADTGPANKESNMPDQSESYPFGEFSAKKWAEEFDRLYPDQRPDTDTMLGWFANAIMTGFDASRVGPSRGATHHPRR